MDYTLTRIDPNGENDRYPCKTGDRRRSRNNRSTARFTWVNSNMRCMTW